MTERTPHYRMNRLFPASAHNERLTMDPPLRILNHATLVCHPGRLEGEALKRALEARALRAHLQERDQFLAWREGIPEDPEITFWDWDDEYDSTPRAPMRGRMSAFDTHAAVTALRNAGIEEGQAEAIVNTMRDAAKADTTEVVTRGELYRALWIQTAALIGAQIAIAAFTVHVLQ